MEYKTIKALNQEKAVVYSSYKMFGWKLEKEEPTKGGKTLLSLIREENIPHLSEIKELEKQYFQITKVPNWVIFALVGIIVLYVSVIAILMLTKVIDLNNKQGALYVAVPAGVLLLITTGISIIRTRDTLKYIDNKPMRDQEFKKKLEDLNHEN